MREATLDETWMPQAKFKAGLDIDLTRNVCIQLGPAKELARESSCSASWRGLLGVEKVRILRSRPCKHVKHVQTIKRSQSQQASSQATELSSPSGRILHPQA